MESLTALTVEEFMKRPREEGVRHELSEGELITVGTAAAKHEMVKFTVLRALFA